MASVYLAPGVYVEEFDSGPVPMAGGPTAVAAFVGFTERIPHENDNADNRKDYKPRLVTSWTQYKEMYGGFGIGDWKLGHRAMLPASVFGYFNNGGLLAYIVPIQWQKDASDKKKPALDKPSTSYGSQDSDEPGEPADKYFGKPFAIGIPQKGAEAETAMELQTGVTDGEVAISIEAGPDDSFGLRVRLNGKEQIHIDELTTVNAAGEIKEQLLLMHEEDERFPAELLVIADGELPAIPKPGKYSLVLPEPDPIPVSPTDFNGDLRERKGIEALNIFDDVTMLMIPDLYNIARRAKLDSVDPRTKDDKKDAVNDAIQEVLTKKKEVLGAKVALAKAKREHKKLKEDVRTGAATEADVKTKAGEFVGLRAAVATAEDAEKVAQGIADDLMDVDGYKKVADDWTDVDLNVWKAAQVFMMNHCEKQPHRLAILDSPPIMKRPDQIQQWRLDEAMYDSQPAALYYPWIQVTDQVENGEMFVPPSGHMAGVWARVDGTRGIHKAPANEVVRGALGLHYEATMTEQMILNPHGINAIRSFSGGGTRVWGARTLSSNDNWKYINVRRLFSWVEKTILDQTQWVVFEPNDQTTWDRVTRTISNFLTGLWRDGALFGASPEEAFYVHCNEETNPFENRENGILTCVVGMAPVMPAEFVVFRVTQKKPE